MYLLYEARLAIIVLAAAMIKLFVDSSVLNVFIQLIAPACDFDEISRIRGRVFR